VLAVILPDGNEGSGDLGGELESEGRDQHYTKRKEEGEEGMRVGGWSMLGGVSQKEERE